MGRVFLMVIMVIFLEVLLQFIYSRKKHRQIDHLCSAAEQNDDCHNTHKPNKYVSKIKTFIAGFMRWKLRMIGYIPSHKLRMFFYRYIYSMTIGRKVVIYGGCEIRAPWFICIGDGTIVGDECKLDGRGGLFIGENVNFSTAAFVWTRQHDLNNPEFSSVQRLVKIEDRAWISSRTTILPGCQVGEGAVIAAGAVLTKNADAYGIYGGVPAKKSVNVRIG
ncbi:hypothetical protein [uncultured Selenomonas sp.]|uniref:acyltransferase n=1 Tax=uncultured Selenomonas sp. TaxID=159275 RepID=UPI002805FEE2|nr:hypothetical protein [uncultured Selenomonas sp.]